MNEARAFHGAVLLKNGKVLLFGGRVHFSPGLADAEIFDPATETFTPTNSAACPGATFPANPPAGCMIDTAYGQQGVLLSDGTVMITGGFKSVRGVEFFDPNTNTFNLSTTRILLPTGADLECLVPARADIRQRCFPTTIMC